MLRQCVLAVTVARVGTLALPPDSFITPRSLVPPHEELSEPAALGRLRGMVGDKHFEFMLHEKQARLSFALPTFYKNRIRAQMAALTFTRVAIEPGMQ